MDEEKLNISIRKFLKNVGITSQRKIEEKIRKAIDSGKLSDSQKIKIASYPTNHLHISIQTRSPPFPPQMPASVPAASCTSKCNNTSNNKFPKCPPRMDDGRHFTNYQPNCYVNNLLQENNGLHNSFQTRMFLTHNATQMMELNRKEACSKNCCGPCQPPYDLGTMMPEASAQVVGGPVPAAPSRRPRPSSAPTATRPSPARPGRSATTATSTTTAAPRSATSPTSTPIRTTTS